MSIVGKTKRVLDPSLKNDGAGWRTIDLDPVTVDQFRAHLEAQAFERRRDDYRDHDLVFANQHGTPYDPDSVTRRFERRSHGAGLAAIRLHDLRHTHATLLLENSDSHKYVAERLGDRVETVIETYRQQVQFLPDAPTSL